MITSYFEDVETFHEKFGLPMVGGASPAPLTTDLARFRIGFMVEELAEFCEASGMHLTANGLRAVRGDLTRYEVGATDLEQAADALADLVYVALGTAHFMGVPFDAVWVEVQRANMEKVRADGAADARSKRRHASDVVKPDGWRKPDHAPALKRAAEEADRW